MNGYHVSSENIQIFPIANRKDKDPLGRLTTEYNLTSILNKLLDVDGFVISWNKNDEIIVFNLHGYLITADLSNIIGSFSGNNIYAYITITDYNNEGATEYEKNFLAQLNGKDVMGNDTAVTNYGKYTGVTFSDSEPTSSQTDIIYHLPILTRIDNSSPWVIPENSTIKFKTDTAGNRSISIDDGILS